MSKRHFGLTQINATQNVTRPPASGAQPLPASHYAPDTRRNLNSLADHSPPGRLNLGIVRDASFLRLSKRPLNPVQELDAVFDHREFAACIFVSLFGVSVGVLLAVLVAFLDFG